MVSQRVEQCGPGSNRQLPLDAINSEAHGELRRQRGRAIGRGLVNRLLHQRLTQDLPKRFHQAHLAAFCLIGGARIFCDAGNVWVLSPSRLNNRAEAINEEYHCHRYCTRQLLLAGTPVLAENPVEPERLARISRRALRRTMQKPARRTIPLRRVVYPIPLPPPRIPLGARPKAKLQACRKGGVGFLPAPPSLASGYLTAFLIFNGQFDRGAAECWARHIRRLAPSTRSVPRLCLITGAIPGFREPVRASELLLILISGVRLGVDASRPSGLA